MPYSLQWRSPALPYTQKQTDIVVNAGAVVSNAASLRFTGKGASNYGKIQQENLIRLLENFAGDTEPDFPTVGQTWYDTTDGVLKVCISTAPDPVVWRSMNAMQVTDVGDPAPTPAALGDTWFQRTGSASGFMYIYTGLGRYPQQTWSSTGYFPDTNTTTLAIKLNTQTFAGAVGSNYNEAYIHGYTGITPADVTGSILVDGVSTSVSPGALFTSQAVSNGYIVWDTTSTLVSSPSSVFFSVRQLDDGTWQYDNNSTWVTFIPVVGMRAIGVLSVAERDQNLAPGITSAVVWDEARLLKSLAQVPNTLANGAIGGWEQVWPSVDNAAGRHEYDFIMNLVCQLIGDPLGFGGGGAIGRHVQYLTPFNTLDASFRQAWESTLPTDDNVLVNTPAPDSFLDKLKVQPNSADWDKLLSAARYAVSRFELPAQAHLDVCPYPFVQDGRNSFAEILTPFSAGDVRRTPDERRSNSRIGIITLNRLYQETVNVLQTAIMNRYVLKGMLGTSGSNPTFNAGVVSSSQATFTANAVGSPFTSAVSHGLQYRFNPAQMDLERFFFSGQAIELVIKHTPSGSPTAADTNLKTATDTYGRIRVTADATYVMDSSLTPALALAPVALGYNNFTLGGIVLATVTVGGAVLTFRGQLISGTTVAVSVEVTAGGATTGSVGTTWSYINDTQTYNGGLDRVYPTPLAFTGTDKTGSGLFV